MPTQKKLMKSTTYMRCHARAHPLKSVMNQRLTLRDSLLYIDRGPPLRCPLLLALAAGD